MIDPMEYARTQVPAAAVEQYKQELMAQARRGAPVTAPTYQPAPQQPTLAQRAAETAEHAMEYAQPVVQGVLSPAQAGLAGAAAKGLALGVEALEDHMERRIDARRTAAPAQNRPIRAEPEPNINLSPSLHVSPKLNVSPTVNISPNIAPNVSATAIVANRSNVSAQPPSGYQPIVPLPMPPAPPVHPAPPQQPSAPPTMPQPPMPPPMPQPSMPQPPRPVPPAVIMPVLPPVGCPPETPAMPCQRPIEPCGDCRPQPRICPVHGKKQCPACTAKQIPHKQDLTAMQAPAMPVLPDDAQAEAAESRLSLPAIFRPRPPAPQPPPPARPPIATPVPPIGQLPTCPVAPLCVCPVPPFNQIQFPAPCLPCPPGQPARPPFSPIQPRAAVTEQQAFAPWYTQPAMHADYGEPYARYVYDMPANTVVMPSSTNATDAGDTLSKVAYIDPTAPPPIAGRTEGGGTWELPSPQYDSLEDFLAKNTGRGVLTMQPLVDESGTPVRGARIRVTKNIGGVDYLFHDVQTDANGEAGRLVLPAPEKQLSERPPSGTPPYALYDVTLSLGGNRPETLHNVVIFADTESIQALDTGEPVNETEYTM